jgi:hypothetical protein
MRIKMNETIRYYFITKSMSYLMLIPNITIDIAYELSDNLYNETIRELHRMIEREILAG